MIVKSTNIYAAASEGWAKIAAQLLRETGGIAKYDTGDESYSYADIDKLISAAFRMSQYYADLAKEITNAGSIILHVAAPEVV